MERQLKTPSISAHPLEGLTSGASIPWSVLWQRSSLKWGWWSQMTMSGLSWLPVLGSTWLMISGNCLDSHCTTTSWWCFKAIKWGNLALYEKAGGVGVFLVFFSKRMKWWFFGSGISKHSYHCACCCHFLPLWVRMQLRVNPVHNFQWLAVWKSLFRHSVHAGEAVCRLDCSWSLHLSKATCFVAKL